ncbi:MAG: hypothetical protein RR253_04560 [Oscillospiraceae bacterium]
MNRQKIIFRQVMKYALLGVSVFLLYIFQSTPKFLQIFGVKPVLIMPFCITLSMLDESWQTIIIYLLGGLLMELSAGRIVGLFTIPLLLICFAGSVAVKFFFKPNTRNSYMFSFMAMLIMLSLDFFFSYVLSGYSHIFMAYVKKVVLLSGYSSLFSVLFHKYIEDINQRFLRFDAR